MPTTTNTGVDLIQSVMANPKCSTTLLVLADWLAENEYADEETICRKEAEALENMPASGSWTLEGIAKWPRDTATESANLWRRRQQLLLCWAVRMSSPSTVTQFTKESGYREGDSYIKVNDRHITMEVEYGVDYGRLTGKAHCKVSTGYGDTKTFPMGKKGFSVGKIVAEVFSQIEGLERRERQREASGQRYHRLADAEKAIEKEFGHNYSDWTLGQAKYGEQLTLSIDRSPEDIRRILTVLKEAGLLTKKGNDDDE